MIVDMIRNDLGRIARTGSVRVPRLYAVEKYPTVWQMTSTVEARTAASLPDILRALFPCASITGAPKVKTMEIIAAIETTPRNIYTGAIGFIAPGRRARFSVAIRTTLIDKTASLAEYGVGGGIVWDSTAEEEYEECLTKAKIILTPPPLPHSSCSKRCSGRRIRDISSWHATLRACASRRAISGIAMTSGGSTPRCPKRRGARRRDRTASACGSPGMERRNATPRRWSLPDSRPLRVRLALHPIDTRDPFRPAQDDPTGALRNGPGTLPRCRRCILYNEAGEVTESCIANVVILRNGRLVTPPLSCGLLNGTYRAELLERGEIHEERVSIPELKQAEKIFLINSVRKWREAALVPGRPAMIKYGFF